MMCFSRHACAAALAVLAAAAAVAGAPAPAIVRFDFEKDAAGWNSVDGAEFPGARCALTHDATQAHNGTGSLKLTADFSGGGMYVGTFRNLWDLKDDDFKEIRLWIKADNVANIGIRIIDNTDQCHQKNGGVTLAATAGWQEVVLKIADLVGGEHWGGANDGAWHGPAKGFGINIGKTSLANAAVTRGTINIDDVATVSGPVVDGHPTVLPAQFNGATSCRPGFEIPIVYRWDAEPMGGDYKVFVHVLGADGRMVLQADHDPALSTAVWSGRVADPNVLYVPLDTPEGTYDVVLGLYRGTTRATLKAGAGITQPAGNPNAYRVGTIRVDAQAPILNELTGPRLNLDGYVLTFDEPFRELSLSAAGPGTRWFTATKENFGDARFMAQKDGFPFSIVTGILPDKPVLRIEAARTNGAWCSGIIASADPKGGGFSQQYGYFEMRALFPKSRGMWPAFWLLGQPALTDRTQPNPEIDVIEHYGVLPNLVISTLHVWHPDGRHWAKGDHVAAPGLTDGFHTYGVLVDEENITFYFDRVAVQRQKTPAEAKVPLYMLVNLAMGGGWPIDQAASPSFMYVDYVRAYAKNR